MAPTHELSRTDARRVAVRAQLLSADRPTALLDVARRLTLLQLDPISTIAPSAHLVLWSRLGATYDPADLDDAVDELRLVELNGLLRPAEDLVLYRDEMARWPEGQPAWQQGAAQWVADNDACRRDILELLRSDGPLPASALPDTCVRPWRSSGWNNDKNVLMLLARMVERGEVAVAGGTGRSRLYDLAERIYPDSEAVPMERALQIRAERRLASLGLARAKTVAVPVERNDVGDVGEPAVVAGVKGEWRVDPAYLGGSFEGRAALLSPFDRLVYDRKRLAEIFEFDYQLEMYKPAARRRWGYYALPILVGDRLVGKLDAKADTRDGVLRVAAIHQDEPFTAGVADAVAAEVEDLAEWLELDLALPR